jgi:hypothetical protein
MGASLFLLYTLGGRFGYKNESGGISQLKKSNKFILNTFWQFYAFELYRQRFKIESKQIH